MTEFASRRPRQRDGAGQPPGQIRSTSVAAGLQPVLGVVRGRLARRELVPLLALTVNSIREAAPPAVVISVYSTVTLTLPPHS